MLISVIIIMIITIITIIQMIINMITMLISVITIIIAIITIIQMIINIITMLIRAIIIIITMLIRAIIIIIIIIITIITTFFDNEQDSFSDDSADHDEEIVPRPSSGTHQGSTTVKNAAKEAEASGSKQAEASGSKQAEASGSKQAEASGSKQAEASGSKQAEASGSKQAEASGSKQAEASGSKQADDHHSTCAEKFILDNGINLLSLKATDIFKYALILMDALFTETEMSTCCFQQAERGALSSKTPLPPGRVKLLEECLETKFGKAAYAANCSIIRDKLNQKCRDKCNMAKKLSKPLTTGETEQHQLSEQ
eukprot:Em0004g1171a